MADDDLRILVSRAALNRRGFLGIGAAGLAGLVLAACGDDEGGGGRTQVTAPEVAKAPTNLTGTLHIYTWAEYQNPDNVKNFQKANNNIGVKIDIYDSNEAAIAKLEAAGANAGYDIVVPTGVYIPQMVSKGLLQELDRSKLPNFANLETQFLNQPWDQGNKYSVVKDWGSTGFIYDNSVVTSKPTDWTGFLQAAKIDGVSGKVTVLDAAGDVTGIAFWSQGIDWNTTNQADFDRIEPILMNDLAPHLKTFESYPVDGLLNGEFVLSQAWNGDARVAKVEDPDRFTWVLGAPKTELWVDNWTILKAAKNPDAAYAFINNILDPKVSAAEIDYHGYNTAVKGTQQYLPADLKSKDMIFFDEAQQANFVPGSIANQDQVTKLYNSVKAAASR